MKKIFFVVLTLTVSVLYDCKKNCPALVESIDVSSETKDVGDSFACSHLMDTTPAAWCGGEDTGGIGEKLTFTFKNAVTLSDLFIVNGSSSNFKDKHRVKKFSILHYINGIESSQEIVLQDHNAMQHIVLKKTITGTKFVFVVKDIYRGTKGKDVCVTEIGFKNFKLATADKKMDKLQIKYNDFILSLSSGGAVSGYGDMLGKDCRQKLFSTGSWGFLQDGQLYIHIDCVLFKKQGSCIDSCPLCPMRENRQFMFIFASLADLQKYKFVESVK